MTKKIDQLTFTRFISALMILLVHFSGGTVFEFPEVKKFLLPFFGVSYFFILSGFVLGVSYYDKMGEELRKFDFKRYTILRLARIYPVYFLAFLLEVFFLVRFGGDTPTFKEIIYSIFLIQSWFSDDFINFPSWSLSCEMFFYASLPWFLFKLKRLKIKGLLVVLVLIWGVQQTSFYYLFVLNNSPFHVLFNPLLHLPTFVAGIIIAIFYRKSKNELIQYIPSVNNWLIAFILIIIIYNKSTFGYETTQTPFYLAFILLVSLPNNFFIKYLSSNFFIYLGYISYSIYILQVPIYQYFDRIYTRLSFTDPNLKYVIFIPLTILVSAGVYFFYEKPVYKFLTKKIR
jgi:peptidoglycan/LPS O-acetylase OafA/YrhL